MCVVQSEHGGRTINKTRTTEKSIELDLKDPDTSDQCEVVLKDGSRPTFRVRIKSVSSETD